MQRWGFLKDCEESHAWAWAVFIFTVKCVPSAGSPQWGLLRPEPSERTWASNLRAGSQVLGSSEMSAWGAVGPERGAPQGPGCWPCSRKCGPPQALPLLTRAGGSVGGGESRAQWPSAWTVDPDGLGSSPASVTYWPSDHGWILKPSWAGSSSWGTPAFLLGYSSRAQWEAGACPEWEASGCSCYIPTVLLDLLREPRPLLACLTSPVSSSVKVMPFANLMSLLGPSVDSVAVLRGIQKVAMLVQGNWVVKR